MGSLVEGDVVLTEEEREIIDRESLRLQLADEINDYHAEFSPGWRIVPGVPLIRRTRDFHRQHDLFELRLLHALKEDQEGEGKSCPQIRRLVEETHKKDDVVEICELVHRYDHHGTINDSNIFLDSRAMNWMLRDYVTHSCIFDDLKDLGFRVRVLEAVEGIRPGIVEGNQLHVHGHDVEEDVDEDSDDEDDDDSLY